MSCCRAGTNLVFLFSIAGAVPAQTIHTVHPGESIQAAIDAAVDGDRVHVLPGTYGPAEEAVETVELSSSAVQGAGRSQFVESVPAAVVDFKGKAIHVIGVGGPLVTTIGAPFSFDSAVRFSAGEGSGSVLQGFTIVGSGFGAALDALAAAPTIQDCLITSGSLGRGLIGDATLERCVIRETYVSGRSAAAGVDGAPTIRHCVIAQNIGLDSEVGGLMIQGGHGVIEDSLILDNEGHTQIGGGAVVRSSAEFTRCLFAGNLALDMGRDPDGGRGGALVCYGSATLTDCTITGNRATQGIPFQNGGIFASAGATVILLNTIVHGNEGDQLVGPIEAAYSNIEGGWPGAGNLDADPLFVDPAQRDFHLRTGSLCVDAGDPGRLDPDGSRSDVGAYPLQHLYALENTLREAWDDPSWPEISVAVGGHQTLRLHAGAQYAGRSYVVLGSLSGSAPGLGLRGLHIPLNPDFYTVFTFLFPHHPPLSGFSGVLDASGSATARVKLPAGSNPSFAGLRANHAFGVFRNGWLELVSNPAPLDLVP